MKKKICRKLGTAKRKTRKRFGRFTLGKNTFSMSIFHRLRYSRSYYSLLYVFVPLAFLKHFFFRPSIIFFQYRISLFLWTRQKSVQHSKQFFFVFNLLIFLSCIHSDCVTKIEAQGVSMTRCGMNWSVHNTKSFEDDLDNFISMR